VDFSSAAQRQLFHALLCELKRLGYHGNLLRKDYPFVDWFERSTPLRTVPAAAFAQTPCTYASVCFGVLLPNGEQGAHLVNRFRALGAPVAFEVHDRFVSQWSVGRDESATKMIKKIADNELRQVFDDNEQGWTASNLLRAKNIGAKQSCLQLDLFVDSGLILAIEAEVQARLHHFLQNALSEAKTIYERDVGRKPDVPEFFRLAFRLLAAKMLRDAGIAEFPSLDTSDTQLLLRKVEDYYGDKQTILSHIPTQEAIATRLWQQVSFANLSFEVLAYIYENTFVDTAARDEYGIHGTPFSIARYITYSLPINDIPVDQRFTVEPCCGHGVFLVAALQRLREDLTSYSPQQRHEYFVDKLSGFDVEPFALEVAKLSLILADFPNPDGWHKRLHREDVFSSSKFLEEIRKARIVLCNPPFRDFTKAQKRSYAQEMSPRPPAAILDRVLRHAECRPLLGFVLPRAFLDGASYKPIRRILAERYDEIETVALPDKVFFESGVETALLLCKHPVTRARVTRVSHIHVPDAGRDQFLKDYLHPIPVIETKTPDEAAHSLRAVALGEAWRELTQCEILANACDIHRGIEWPSPFDEAYVTSPPCKPGYKPGIFSADNMKAYESPEVRCLDVRHKRDCCGAFDLPWDLPKVFLPANRLSRGPWCLAAFPDEVGLVGYQNFTALWPRKQWTANVLSAILNGPVAAAFVAVREDKLHIHKRTLRGVPLPNLSDGELSTIERAVARFMRAIRRARSCDPSLRDLLLLIDATILAGYHLSPPTERSLLNYFRGRERPISCQFPDYLEKLILNRLHKQTIMLEDDKKEQKETWKFLKKALDEDRLSSRKLFS